MQELLLMASVLAVSVAVVTGGCGNPTAISGTPLDVGAGTWELVDGTVDGEAMVVPDGSRITLLVDGDQVGGTSACNGYGTSWQLDGSHVQVGPGMSGTEMGCEPDVMAAESTYLGALPRVDRGTQESGELRLSGAGVQLRFVQQPPVPTTALVGATWVLETLLNGEVTSSVAGDAATLLLAGDGSLTGSTGCRSLSGQYVVVGDEVLFTSFAADGDCPDDLAAQDGQVVTVLGDGFRASVEENRLTVASDGGLGLVYRSSDR